MTPKKLKKRKYWFEKLAAIVALVNFVLVIFDLTYIPARDVYLQNFPELTVWYDPVKGIEAHPETQNYLNRVRALDEQVAQTGLISPEGEARLSEMRELSDRLVQDDPFALADRSRILENIKQQIRQRVGVVSARDAFDIFWSSAYLSQAGWQQEISFFNDEIRPQMASNYHRELNQFNQFVNYFWIIDAPFILFFALEILARTFYLSQRRPDLNWVEAILRRWYDVFLLLPFWRWLRIIPVTLRLYQADLLDLNPIRAQFSHDFAINFAGELMETVGVQVIDQMQNSIRDGTVTQLFSKSERDRPYIQVKNRNEVELIASHLVNISVHDVMPQIQPELTDLIHHNITKTLNQSAAYRQLQNLPGIGHVPQQLTTRLAKELAQATHTNLAKALNDPEGAELTARLIDKFRSEFETELQKKQNVQELKTLLIDMLEEIKINYVKNVAFEDIERVVEEAERLQRSVQR